MIRITVPVTIGGKNRSSCEKNGATRIMNSPHAIVAPNTAWMPSLWPIAIIGPTAANVTPCMSGQSHAEPPEPDGLDDRRDARDEEVGADQEREVGRRVAQRAADDERHRDRAGVHRQDVLQPEREEARERGDAVDRVRAALGGFRRLAVVRR